MDALTDMIPEFAVLGHPNEGKSSVVSTLTEDDQIKISPIPGETTAARTYTVTIDGQKVIRFVDTPGFQAPQQTLAWFKAYDREPSMIIDRFIEANKNDPLFSDECELLKPVLRGAGIIYVVDGSRPVRDDDIAEMEILRLTGRARMAVINSKQQEKDFTSDWKQAFSRHFNSIRTFNSNTANFYERIRMLESLKAIDQDWEPLLEKVISAFRQDWQKRIRLTHAHIIQHIEKSLLFNVSESLEPGKDRTRMEENLNKAYQKGISRHEKEMFLAVRQLFKHNLYDITLPEDSILKHDLFSKQTWELLGLTKEQLAAAGAVIGGTMGAVMDTAAAGITFGVFTAIGGVIGAGSALLGGKKIAKKKIPGLNLGGDMLQLGPNQNIQFFYVMLDRALIYFSHMVNRPHGKRTSPVQDGQPTDRKQGFSSALDKQERTVCNKFFKSVTSRSIRKDKNAVLEFTQFLEEKLSSISIG